MTEQNSPRYEVYETGTGKRDGRGWGVIDRECVDRWGDPICVADYMTEAMANTVALLLNNCKDNER